MENQLQKAYLAIGLWHDKATGQPKTRLAELNMGTGKESGKEYAIVETERGNIFVDEYHPIGSIVYYNMEPTEPAQPAVPAQPTQQAPPAPPPEARSLKIGKSDA